MRKSALPTAFVQHFVESYYSSRYSLMQVHKEFIHRAYQLKNGLSKAGIPGYDGVPPFSPRTGIPIGWSYCNLRRRIPAKFQQLNLFIHPPTAA